MTPEQKAVARLKFFYAEASRNEVPNTAALSVASPARLQVGYPTLYDILLVTEWLDAAEKREAALTSEVESISGALAEKVQLLHDEQQRRDAAERRASALAAGLQQARQEVARECITTVNDSEGDTDFAVFQIRRRFHLDAAPQAQSQPAPMEDTSSQQWQIEHLKGVIAALQEERKSIREEVARECAKMQCWHCRNNTPFNAKNSYWHEHGSHTVPCYAYDIRHRHNLDTPQAQPEPPAAAIELIREERQRQVSAEGWTPEHDDQHVNGELAIAAACYASPEPLRAKRQAKGGGMFDAVWCDPWPWDAKWDKRGTHDRTRQLVIAGALIVAEIERLRRADEPKPESPTAGPEPEGKGNPVGEDPPTCPVCDRAVFTGRCAACGYEAKPASLFTLAQVHEHIRKCAAAVCARCAASEPVVPRATGTTQEHTPEWYWVHQDKVRDFVYDCKASPIWCKFPEAFPS